MMPTRGQTLDRMAKIRGAPMPPAPTRPKGGCSPHVYLEAVQGVGHELRADFGQHGPEQGFHGRGTAGVKPFLYPHVHALYGLGEELGQHAYGVYAYGQDAGRSARPHDTDEDQGKDELGKGAHRGDYHLAKLGYPVTDDVLAGYEGHRYGQDGRGKGAGYGDGQGLHNGVGQTILGGIQEVGHIRLREAPDQGFHGALCGLHDALVLYAQGTPDHQGHQAAVVHHAVQDLQRIQFLLYDDAFGFIQASCAQRC
jgi:hypothetical protein